MAQTKNATWRLPRYHLFDAETEIRSSYEALGLKILKVEDDHYIVNAPEGWLMRSGHRVQIFDQIGHLRIEFVHRDGGIKLAWISSES